MKKKFYGLRHDHKYGENFYVFTSTIPYQKMSPERIAKKLDLDFEPKRDEWLELSRVEVWQVNEQ